MQVDGSTVMAGAAVIGIAFMLHRVANRPPPTFRREGRSIPLGYNGTQKLQSHYPQGGYIPYQPNSADWNPAGVDIYSGHYGVH